VSGDGALGWRIWHGFQVKQWLVWVKLSLAVHIPMVRSESTPREVLGWTSSDKCKGPLWWSGLRTGGEGWCPGRLVSCPEGSGDLLPPKRVNLQRASWPCDAVWVKYSCSYTRSQ